MRRLRVLWRKGFTLVELVLAIAITSIVVSFSASLISLSVYMRKQSLARADMYSVSLRLHKAIDSELRVADSVVLYQTPKTSFDDVSYSSLEKYKVMYLSEGAVYLGYKGTSHEELLPTDASTTGFDSYNGVNVDSVVFKPISSRDHLSSENSETTDVYRCIEVITTVSKDSWTYTHSSTVYFDEMILTSNQVKVNKESNPNYASDSDDYPVKTDESLAFHAVRYRIQ